MPNRDKTGPQGEGPKTGRGAGECGDKNEKQVPKRDGSGRGIGQRGDGRGMGRNRSK